MNGKVLIVNDDATMRSSISAGLQQEGFTALEAGDYETALRITQSLTPDAIVIDVKVSPASLDGLDLCRRFRLFTDVPILFLSVCDDEIDQLLGLAVGADDHLKKPISQKLLAARVSALLRRAQGSLSNSNGENVLQRGDICINKEERTIKVNSKPVYLTRTEFDLLVALAEKPTRVYSRDQLVESVWGDWTGNGSLLDVHMSRLRKKIAEAGGPRVGHAVRGFGYRYSE